MENFFLRGKFFVSMTSSLGFFPILGDSTCRWDKMPARRPGKIWPTHRGNFAGKKKLLTASLGQGVLTIIIIYIKNFWRLIYFWNHWCQSSKEWWNIICRIPGWYHLYPQPSAFFISFLNHTSFQIYGMTRYCNRAEENPPYRDFHEVFHEPTELVYRAWDCVERAYLTGRVFGEVSIAV